MHILLNLILCNENATLVAFLLYNQTLRQNCNENIIDVD